MRADDAVVLPLAGPALDGLGHLLGLVGKDVALLEPLEDALDHPGPGAGVDSGVRPRAGGLDHRRWGKSEGESGGESEVHEASIIEASIIIEGTGTAFRPSTRNHYGDALSLVAGGKL